MSYKWYVVHVYSGSEKRVKETIEEQMKSKNMEDFIEDILVPTEEIFEIRKGTKVKTEKKFFPGYLLIKMNMTDESWHFVKSQPKVTNFLGARFLKAFDISNRVMPGISPPIIQTGRLKKSLNMFRIFCPKSPLPCGIHLVSGGQKLLLLTKKSGLKETIMSHLGSFRVLIVFLS